MGLLKLCAYTGGFRVCVFRADLVLATLIVVGRLATRTITHIDALRVPGKSGKIPTAKPEKPRLKSPPGKNVRKRLKSASRKSFRFFVWMLWYFWLKNVMILIYMCIWIGVLVQVYNNALLYTWAGHFAPCVYIDKR